MREGSLHHLFWRGNSGLTDEILPVTFDPGTIASVTGYYAADEQRHMTMIGATQGIITELWSIPGQTNVEGNDYLPVTFDFGTIVSDSGHFSLDSQHHVVVVGT